MGPYSEDMQFKRADSIVRLLSHKGLPLQARRIWENHLQNLSRNESTYNFRVREIYSKMKRNVIDYG